MKTVLSAEFVLTDVGVVGGRTMLVLHGGGGPQTVAPLVGHFSRSFHVLAPTHPGWEHTHRSEELDSVATLATAYLELLVQMGEKSVIIVGSSIGAWIALEMAIQAGTDERYERVVGAVVDLDGVGAVVEGEQIADFFSLTPRALAELAWHDPALGYRDPASFSDEQRAAAKSNGDAMAAIAGRAMSDPTLLARLQSVEVPTLVLFGESDRIVTPAYGRAVAASIPGAQYATVPAAGHLPHLENPQATMDLLDSFIRGV